MGIHRRGKGKGAKRSRKNDPGDSGDAPSEKDTFGVLLERRLDSG